MTLRGLASAVVVLGLAAAGGRAAEPVVWPDDFVGRLEALALIETLNAELLSHDSATLTLERWCSDHRLADPARIVAERVHDDEKPATAEVRAALDVKPDEPLGYRRVRLKCGDRVLSEVAKRGGMGTSGSSRRGVILLAAVLGISAVLGGLYGPTGHARAASANDIPDSVKGFTRVLSIVERNYADPVDVDKAIYDGAIPAMLPSPRSSLEFL